MRRWLLLPPHIIIEAADGIKAVFIHLQMTRKALAKLASHDRGKHIFCFIPLEGHGNLLVLHHEQLLLSCDLLPEMFFTFFSIMREL